MLVLLMAFAAQEGIAAAMLGADVRTCAMNQRRLEISPPARVVSLARLRGGQTSPTSSMFYVHDGLNANSRRHMSKSLAESPEWKELREILRLRGDVSAAVDGVVASPNGGLLEAASKLVENHLRIVLDVTNPFARSQRHLGRLSLGDQPMIDSCLLEIAHRLLVRHPDGSSFPRLQPEREGEAQVWAKVVAFLDKRLQSSAEELPERHPDLSPSAAQALRAVLGEMGGASI